jgi:hypothetical protein
MPPSSWRPEERIKTDRRMVGADGRPLLPDNELQAAWLAIEHGACPVDPDEFVWDRVLTLAGSRPIDPRVYEPGSAL